MGCLETNHGWPGLCEVSLSLQPTPYSGSELVGVSGPLLPFRSLEICTRLPAHSDLSAPPLLLEKRGASVLVSDDILLGKGGGCWQDAPASLPAPQPHSLSFGRPGGHSIEGCKAMVWGTPAGGRSPHFPPQPPAAESFPRSSEIQETSRQNLHPCPQALSPDDGADIRVTGNPRSLPPSGGPLPASLRPCSQRPGLLSGQCSCATPTSSSPFRQMLPKTRTAPGSQTWVRPSATGAEMGECPGAPSIHVPEVPELFFL